MKGKIRFKRFEEEGGATNCPAAREEEATGVRLSYLRGSGARGPGSGSVRWGGRRKKSEAKRGRKEDSRREEKLWHWNPL